jgi:hypothetical protein
MRQESPPSEPADRGRLTDAIAHALRARARHRTARRWATGLAAAVVVLAGGVVLRLAAPPGTSRPLSSGNERDLTVLDEVIQESDGADAFLAGRPPMHLKRGMTLPAGIRLTSPSDAEVQLGSAAGMVMTMEKAASMTVTDAGATQRFALHTGAVRVHVAPLAHGERFVIDTRDAEIEVHGTTFRVAVLPPDATCADPARTRISVAEGVVAVRSHADEVRLAAGSTWVSVCVAAPLAPTAVSVSTQTRAQTAAPLRPMSGPRRTPAAAASSASLLADQNNLFAAAVRARNQGQGRAAVTWFDRLIHEYPASPLAESAAAQRMKILSSIDATAGAQAAADYLHRFPFGFARGEAQRLLQESPTR